MNTKTTGVAAITGASLMWAIEPIFAKPAYESSDYLETLVLSSVYQVLVGVTVGIVLLIVGVYFLSRKEEAYF